MVLDLQWKRKQHQSSHHQFINRKLRSCDDLLSSGRHVTRISVMSSEEPRLSHSSSAKECFRLDHPNSETVEDEDEWRRFENYLQKKMNDIIVFARSHYDLVTTILFWMFLPIALPLVICKSILYDFMKIRRIFVLTLEGLVMQLEVLIEQMSFIRNSNSSIDVKIEKMGRSFHFLNMLNPLYWMGMFSNSMDHCGSPTRGSCIENGIKNSDRSRTSSPDKLAKTDGEPERSSHVSTQKAESPLVKKNLDVASEKHASAEGDDKHHSNDEEKSSAVPEDNKEGNSGNEHDKTVSNPRETENNAGGRADEYF